MKAFLLRFAADRNGSPAIEFALILPLLAMLLFGAISAAQLAGAVSGMNYAVGQAARCSAVNAALCGTASATETYAQSLYKATAVQPTFAASDSGCGHTVTASVTLELNLAISVIDVPLSATACFPGVDA